MTRKSTIQNDPVARQVQGLVCKLFLDIWAEANGNVATMMTAAHLLLETIIMNTIDPNDRVRTLDTLYNELQVAIETNTKLIHVEPM
jgi:hypothetical protein